MSIINEENIPTLTDKVVREAVSGMTSSGYGLVEIRFTDGTILLVEEMSQTGQILWTFPTEETTDIRTWETI